MAKQAQPRVGILQGTLEMLILRTLLYGPAHGHQIGKHIQTTNEFLRAARTIGNLETTPMVPPSVKRLRRRPDANARSVRSTQPSIGWKRRVY